MLTARFNDIVLIRTITETHIDIKYQNISPYRQDEHLYIRILSVNPPRPLHAFALPASDDPHLDRVTDGNPFDLGLFFR